jgi:uncharacterized protein (TIGR02118 family)
MFCASVAYPADIDSFDIEYFRTRHVPMFAQLLGDNCVRWEVHRALAAPGAPPPPFVAAAYFWIADAERFGVTLAEHGEAIYQDIARFSSASPVRGWSAVIS